MAILLSWLASSVEKLEIDRIVVKRLYLALRLPGFISFLLHSFCSHRTVYIFQHFSINLFSYLSLMMKYHYGLTTI